MNIKLNSFVRLTSLQVTAEIDLMIISALTKRNFHSNFLPNSEMHELCHLLIKDKIDLLKTNYNG